MSGDVHRAVQRATAAAGVEALSLRSDRAFPRHAHDHFGVGVLVAGAHRSWSGRGPVEAAAGDVIAVNPGEMHDGLPVGRAARGWRMLHLDPSAMAREAGEGGAEVEIARPALRDPALARRLLAAFAALTAPSPDPLLAEEALARAVALLLGRHGARPAPRPERSAPVGRALQRLDDAPERAVTLADLATLAGVGRFALLRAFAREVGTTPHAYLLQRRVRLARRWLAAGEAPAAAAALSGFADQSHMTRAFVRQLGVTPARYRAAVAPHRR